MNTQFLSKAATLMLLLAIAMAGSISTIQAQTRALVLTSTLQDKKEKPSTSVVYLKDDKMVTETQNGKHTSTMLFDANNETIYIINHKKKEYTEMTREDMVALNAMLQEQLAALDQQLAMLPEKQRDILKQKMGAALGAGQKPAEYSLEASGVMVEKWKTDKYIATVDEKKQSEMYFASFQQLGQPADEFKAMDGFLDLMKNFTQSITKNMPTAGFDFFGENMPSFSEGIPVKTILFNAKGEPTNTTTLNSVEKKTVEDAVFMVPEKYKKQKMGESLSDLSE